MVCILILPSGSASLGWQQNCRKQIEVNEEQSIPNIGNLKETQEAILLSEHVIFLTIYAQKNVRKYKLLAMPVLNFSMILNFGGKNALWVQDISMVICIVYPVPIPSPPIPTSPQL